MKYYFIVKDHFDPQFLKALFRKKLDKGIFSGRLIDAKQQLLSPKIPRITKAVVCNA